MPFAAELERKVRCHPEREIDPVQEILLQTNSNDSLRKTPREKNYAIQHRNNPRRHRDPVRPGDLHHRRAASAGRSYPSCAGDYFRRKHVSPRLVQIAAAVSARGYNCSRATSGSSFKLPRT
jgi:hypothetical protein